MIFLSKLYFFFSKFKCIKYQYFMKFNFKFLGIIILVLSFLNCKTTTTIAELNTLKEVAKSKNFKFVANTANPTLIAGVTGIESLLPIGSNFANINLTDNTNFLMIKNDSLNFFMPYYGERRMGGQYSSSDGGLSYEGKANQLETTFNPKKNSYVISCEVTKNQENLKLRLTLYANTSATLNVISSHRSSIDYSGNWQKK